MYTWRELWELYMLSPGFPSSNLQPRYNICPITAIDAVISLDGKRVYQPMRWGLVPGWWKKPLKELRLATFNARAETVADKPFFRSAFKRTRCLIPASGYYEWHTVGKEKQPYYFTRAGGPAGPNALPSNVNKGSTGGKLTGQSGNEAGSTAMKPARSTTGAGMQSPSKDVTKSPASTDAGMKDKKDK
jgi:hypothetical protein